MKFELNLKKELKFCEMNPWKLVINLNCKILLKSVKNLKFLKNFKIFKIFPKHKNFLQVFKKLNKISLIL